MTYKVVEVNGPNTSGGITDIPEGYLLVGGVSAVYDPSDRFNKFKYFQGMHRSPYAGQDPLREVLGGGLDSSKPIVRMAKSLAQGGRGGRRSRRSPAKRAGKDPRTKRKGR